jgi:hypothetical protein
MMVAGSSGFGAPRVETVRGGHLILGYQKSESAPSGFHAKCWMGDGSKANAKWPKSR